MILCCMELLIVDLIGKLMYIIQDKCLLGGMVIKKYNGLLHLMFLLLK